MTSSSRAVAAALLFVCAGLRAARDGRSPPNSARPPLNRCTAARGSCSSTAISVSVHSRQTSFTEESPSAAANSSLASPRAPRSAKITPLRLSRCRIGAASLRFSSERESAATPPSVELPCAHFMEECASGGRERIVRDAEGWDGVCAARDHQKKTPVCLSSLQRRRACGAPRAAPLGTCL